jgi:hypothetical protein
MHQMCISTNQVSSVVLMRKKLKSKKNAKTVKEPKKQKLCHKIELNPSKDRTMHEIENPWFWDNLIKFTFFTELFILVFLSKYRST